MSKQHGNDNQYIYFSLDFKPSGSTLPRAKILFKGLKLGWRADFCYVNCGGLHPWNLLCGVHRAVREPQAHSVFYPMHSNVHMSPCIVSSGMQMDESLQATYQNVLRLFSSGQRCNDEPESFFNPTCPALQLYFCGFITPCTTITTLNLYGYSSRKLTIIKSDRRLSHVWNM